MRMRNALSRGFDLLRKTHFLFMFSEKLNVTLEDRRDIQLAVINFREIIECI